MTNHDGFVFLSMSVLLLFGSTAALAQQASSFEQLQVLVQKGDQVSVTTGDGKVTKGSIEAVSTSSLRLVQNRVPIEMAQVDVLEIKKKDPIANGVKMGALVGAGVGAGFGFLGAIISCGDADCAPEAAAIGAATIGLSAGIGAGIGALVDAVSNRNPVVYRARPGTTTEQRIRITPLLSASRTGVRVSLSF
jgi:hypothetical protein